MEYGQFLWAAVGAFIVRLLASAADIVVQLDQLCGHLGAVTCLAGVEQREVRVYNTL